MKGVCVLSALRKLPSACLRKLPSAVGTVGGTVIGTAGGTAGGTAIFIYKGNVVVRISDNYVSLSKLFLISARPEMPIFGLNRRLVRTRVQTFICF